MIDDTLLCFPNNVVDILALRIKQKFDQIDPSGDTIVITRPVTTLDADQTIAVVPVDWKPGSSPEIGRKSNQFENSIQAYSVMVQVLVNDMNEDKALRRHSLISTLVRRMLYRDTILLSALTQLQVVADGVTETTTQFGIRSQQFLVTQRESSFQYLSVIEFWLETQTT